MLSVVSGDATGNSVNGDIGCASSEYGVANRGDGDDSDDDVDPSQTREEYDSEDEGPRRPGSFGGNNQGRTPHMRPSGISHSGSFNQQ